MLLFAMSPALETTIVYVLVWFVVFPAIVTGLIAVAIFGALGEKRQNDRTASTAAEPAPGAARELRDAGRSGTQAGSSWGACGSSA